MQYVRVYADDDGESHFDDVTALMTAVESAPLAPPITVSAPGPLQHNVRHADTEERGKTTPVAIAW